MAGIYIHIPYCRQACYYCNFHFSTSLKTVDAMVESIILEVELRDSYVSGEINSIYFGGGTPSIIASDRIAAILEKISQLHTIKSSVEITLEANPEDINNQLVTDLKTIGVNRISLGIQSFDDLTLQSFNRVHTCKQGYNAITTLQKLGFENISTDLIYGIPGQSLETWENNLTEMLKFGIPHLSCYALTIEEKTAFGKWATSGKFKAVAEDKYVEEYKRMCHLLEEADYEHYELSSFAKAGYKSQHNSSYWLQQPYLGLGPGAHSYNGASRQFNLSNNAKYIKAINSGTAAFEIEHLSASQKINEYILTGLRTNMGIDLELLKSEFGLDLLKTKNNFINHCIKNKKAIVNDGRFILTDEALILADSIIIELMIDE